MPYLTVQERIDQFFNNSVLDNTSRDEFDTFVRAIMNDAEEDGYQRGYDSGYEVGYSSGYDMGRDVYES